MVCRCFLRMQLGPGDSFSYNTFCNTLSYLLYFMRMSILIMAETESF